MTLSRDLHPLRYADVMALAVAAPPLLLSGTSPAGYAAGALTWLVIRALGLAIASSRSAIRGPKEQAALWLGYRMARIVLLGGATIAVRELVGSSAGITALAVIVSGFTIQLLGSLIERPKRTQPFPGARF
jgi:hypothetical protein